MWKILYDKEDIADMGFKRAIDTGRMKINGYGYTLVDQYGCGIKRYVHSSISDPDVMFVKQGDPFDLVDNRYLDAYRMVGREDFLEIIRQNPDITPNKAFAVATRIQLERKLILQKKRQS